MVMRNIWRKSAIALIVITTSLVVHGGRNQGMRSVRSVEFAINLFTKVNSRFVNA